MRALPDNQSWEEECRPPVKRQHMHVHSTIQIKHYGTRDDGAVYFCCENVFKCCSCARDSPVQTDPNLIFKEQSGGN